jgi:hypothetical protein
VFHRDLRAQELEQVLALHPMSAGHELVGWDRAVAAWRWLIAQRSFKAAVIESETPIHGKTVVGFGATAFVRQVFVDREIENPEPGLNSRIIDAGNPVVLDDKELRAQNTKGGLDTVGLYGTWRRDGLTSEQIRDAKLAIAAAALENHSGYRHRRVLAEASDAGYIQFTEDWRVFRTVSRYEEFHSRNSDATWNRDRALVEITRATALRSPASFAAHLFNYGEPCLWLGDTYQEMLSAALRGLTDEELCQALGAKLPTIKKQWATIFSHVAAVKPDLLPDVNDDRRIRGRQKRHHLLAYLRLHPEELRPLLISRKAQGQ